MDTVEKSRKVINDDSINNFLTEQRAYMTCSDAEKLVVAIIESIEEYKEDGGENGNAFSVDAQFDDGEFTAQCNFSEDYTMTVMYCEETEDKVVESLYLQKNLLELFRLAGLMLSEKWVAGYED